MDPDRTTIKEKNNKEKTKKKFSHPLFPLPFGKSAVAYFLNLYGNPARITNKSGPVYLVIDRRYLFERFFRRIHLNLNPVDFDKEKNEKKKKPPRDKGNLVCLKKDF